MSPMAGKPQRTDEPETYYDSSERPQQRQRPPPTKPDSNDRGSGYDVYDNYFDNNDNRQSGMGALGLGFLNGSMDDEDSDDEDARSANKKTAEDPFKSKHELLAARAATKSASPPPKHIAAPQPGYVAPIATLNLAKPEAAAAPSGPGSQRRGNPNLVVATDRTIPPPAPESPHPLQASPITPAFARPRPPKAPEVSFGPEKGGIMRGDGEHTMLPKRGEAGDDFWRRFSMVAKESKTTGNSSAWLRKTQNGTSRLATWVWVVGLVLALCAAGGIGIGWYVSHKSPDHQQPTVFGGSAGEAAPSTSLKAVGSGNPSIKSSLAVRPTHTVQRRYVPRAQVTAAPGLEEHRRAAGPAAWRH
jgi:hypothetical protein